MHDDVVVFGVDDAEALVGGDDLEDFPDVAEIDHAAAAVGGFADCGLSIWFFRFGGLMRGFN